MISDSADFAAVGYSCHHGYLICFFLLKSSRPRSSSMQAYAFFSQVITKPNIQNTIPLRHLDLNIMMFFAQAPRFHWLALWLALPFLVANFRTQAQQMEYRINVGSNKTWADGQGRVWGPDVFSIGRQFNSICAGDPIAGTTIDTIYCTNRYFTKANSNNGPFLLEVPLTQAGNYVVRLHFAETVSDYGVMIGFWSIGVV